MRAIYFKFIRTIFFHKTRFIPFAILPWIGAIMPLGFFILFGNRIEFDFIGEGSFIINILLASLILFSSQRILLNIIFKHYLITSELNDKSFFNPIISNVCLIFIIFIYYLPLIITYYKLMPG